MRGYTVSIDDVNPVAAAPGNQDFTRDPASSGEVISVTLRFEWASLGVPLVGAATGGTLRVRLPADAADIGATIVLVPVGDTGSSTHVLRFDANPFDGVIDAARWGELEILFHVSRGAAIAWGPADSRGAYAAPVALTANHNARGYIRRTGRLDSHSISNTAIAGAEPSSFASPDPIHTRLTWDAVAYRSQTQTLSLRRGGGGVMEREEALANTTITRDFSWTGTASNNRRIGNGMFVGSELKDLRVDISALDSFVPASGDNEYILSVAGQQTGWTRNSDLQLTNTNRLTADPRITIAHLLQVDNATFGTPPLVNDVAGHDRLASQLGFAANRYRNARVEGINSIVSTESLFDNAGLIAPLSQSATTATKGGEAGWSGTFLAWDSQLPTGDWTHRADVTTTDLTDLEIGADDIGFTLLAPNLS